MICLLHSVHPAPSSEASMRMHEVYTVYVYWFILSDHFGPLLAAENRVYSEMT